MKAFKAALDRAFNWKKHPGGVFFIAIPLTVLAFALHFIVALHKYRVEGDPTFLIIISLGFAAVAFVFWQLHEQVKAINEANRLRDEILASAEEARQKLRELDQR